MTTNNQNPDRILLLLSAFLWFLAILISSIVFNPLDALINPFRWWVSFKEVIELLIFIPSNIATLPQLFAAHGTQEKALIWMGLPAVIGWIVGLVGIYRIDASRRQKFLYGLGVFLFVPLLGLISTGSAIRRPNA